MMHAFLYKFIAHLLKNKLVYNEIDIENLHYITGIVLRYEMVLKYLMLDYSHT